MYLEADIREEQINALGKQSSHPGDDLVKHPPVATETQCVLMHFSPSSRVDLVQCAECKYSECIKQPLCVKRKKTRKKGTRDKRHQTRVIKTTRVCRQQSCQSCGCGFVHFRSNR